MSRYHKLHLVFLSAALCLLVGCSKVTGTAAVAGWSSSAAYPVLRSISAAPDTKWEIYLVNAPILNQLETLNTKPVPTTGVGGARPPSESAFVRYSMTLFPCYLGTDFADQYGPDARPGGAPTALVSVAFGRKLTTGNRLSVCVGPRQASPSGPTRTSRTSTAVASVTGYVDRSGWTGFRGTDQHRFVIGTDVPVAQAESVVKGTAASASLVDDPDVRAVLEHADNSAWLLMGSELLEVGFKNPGTAKAKDAVAQAEKTTGQQLPTARFSGAAWTPGSGRKGTMEFLTVYASEAEAKKAATVLQAALKGADPLFDGSTTEAVNSTVVTSTTDVGPTTFDLRNLRLLEYPGYVTG